MKRDSKAFRLRFLRWKNGEKVYDNGRALPEFEDGTEDDYIYNMPTMREVVVTPSGSHIAPISSDDMLFNLEQAIDARRAKDRRDAYILLRNMNRAQEAGAKAVGLSLATPAVAAGVSTVAPIVAPALPHITVGALGGEVVNEGMKKALGYTWGQGINLLTKGIVPEWLGDFTNPGYAASMLAKPISGMLNAGSNLASRLILSNIPYNPTHFYRGVSKEAILDAERSGILKGKNFESPYFGLGKPEWHLGYVIEGSHGSGVDWVSADDPTKIIGSGTRGLNKPGSLPVEAFPQYNGSTQVPADGFTYWKKYPIIGWRLKLFKLYNQSKKSPSIEELFINPEHSGTSSQIVTDPTDAGYVLKKNRRGLTTEQLDQAISANEALNKYPFVLPQYHVKTIAGSDGLYYPIWRQEKITPFGREAIYDSDGRLLQGEALESARQKSLGIADAVRRLAQQSGLLILDGRILTPDGLIQDFGEFHNVGRTSSGKPVIFDAQLNPVVKMSGSSSIAKPSTPPYEIQRYPGYMLKTLMAGNPLERQLSRTGTISVNSIKAQAAKASAVEKDVIEKILSSEQFAGQKTIDYNTFRKAVLDELITYQRKPQTRHQEYGADELGLLEPQGKVKFNTFTFESPRIPIGNNKHYDTSTLGHSRTYTTADEPEVLHVMESQSDWAQAKKPEVLKDADIKTLLDLEDEIAFQKINGANGFVGISHDDYMRDLERARSYVDPQQSYLRQNYLQKLLQENLKYAAERGQTKMKYPTRETAAKIEGYSKNRVLNIDKNILYDKLIIAPNGRTNIKNTPFGEPYYVEPGEGLSYENLMKRNGELYNKLGGKSKQEMDDWYSSLPIIERYLPAHETILKKHDAFPKQFKKLYKDANVRTIFDSRGNSWYEVDVPKDYLNQEWQFGLIPGLIGTGAAYGASKQKPGYEDGKESKWSNATIGAAVAENSAVMNASGWKLKDGYYVQDPDVQTAQLANSLANIAMMSPTHPINAILKGAFRLLVPYIKFNPKLNLPKPKINVGYTKPKVLLSLSSDLGKNKIVFNNNLDQGLLFDLAQSSGEIYDVPKLTSPVDAKILTQIEAEGLAARKAASEFLQADVMPRMRAMKHPHVNNFEYTPDVSNAKIINAPKNSTKVGGWNDGLNTYIVKNNSKVPIDEIMVHEFEHQQRRDMGKMLVELNNPKTTQLQKAKQLIRIANGEPIVNFGYTPEEQKILKDAYKFPKSFLKDHPNIDPLAEMGGSNREGRYYLSKLFGVTGKELDASIKNMPHEQIEDMLKHCNSYTRSWLSYINDEITSVKNSLNMSYYAAKKLVWDKYGPAIKNALMKVGMGAGVAYTGAKKQ